MAVARGMRMAHIPEPSNTITFGEKRKSSYHAHMDFYQGDGNDVQEIDQAKHGARREGEGGRMPLLPMEVCVS